MNIRKAFAKALKDTRKAKELTQEDFSGVSSRTYMSALERELKSPTLDKIADLALVLKVHPLTLLVMTYADAKRGNSHKALMEKVLREIDDILASSNKR